MRDFVVRFILLPVVTCTTALCVAAGPVRGQNGPLPPLVIAERACDTCRLRIEHVTTLGPSPDAFFAEPWLVRRADGSVMVGPTADFARFAVFSRSGSFLRSVGRRGSALGEFRLIDAAIDGPGDSIYVFDGVNRSLSVLSPDFVYRRGLKLDLRALSAIRLPDDAIVVNAEIRTPELFGLPLHVIAPAHGRIVRSFPAADATIEPRQEFAQHRVIALGRDAVVWAGRLDRYEVEAWTSAGRLLRTITRSPEWWVRNGTAPYSSRDQVRSTARLRGLQVMEDSTLWVLVHVPRDDPDNRPGRVAPRGGKSPAHGHESRPLFDTVIEVIDLRRGRLLVSRRFPDQYFGFSGPRQVHSRRITSSGQQVIDTWQLHLDIVGR